MTRRVPIFATVIVLAAVATMIALGVWQLGRKGEKEALIARYQAAQAQQDRVLLDPASPDAAYTITVQYCADPAGQRVTAGKSAKGQSGWTHVVRCTIGGPWPNTKQAYRSMAEAAADAFGQSAPPSAADRIPNILNDPQQARAPAPVEVVLGWSRSADPVAWDGGAVGGTVVHTGEFGVRIVASPPLAGLEASAKPDPGDLPNNHLAYAGQWFFFALTALVIYVLALRRRRR
jgi:surfeit locus 1 family protein